MPDYSKCVIYTIKTGDGLYVGSTCNFVKRKSNHKRNIINEKYKLYNKLYNTIRENEGAWDMQPHSVYPCASKIEMNIEEERVRKELNADLNMNSCYGFDIEKNKQYKKEYNLKNKEKHAEQMKEYNLKNKEKIKQYKKEWYLKKKENLFQFYSNHVIYDPLKMDYCSR